MNVKGWFLIVVFGMLLGCSKNEIQPQISNEAYLQNSIPISSSDLKSMEGVYSLENGVSFLGNEFVCKVSKNKVSFFGNKGVFLILKAGFDASDSSIKFAGSFRSSEDVLEGKVQFQLTKNNGLTLFLKQKNPANILLDGFVNDRSTQTLQLKYKRAFSSTVLQNEFVIFAHHGIQTTSNPPFSPNSLNVIKYAEEYGCNGLEVDVRMSADHVPLLFHDESFSSDAVSKSGVLADVNQLSFNAIQRVIFLNDGQRIPSLKEALRTAIDSTELGYVWLDIKGGTDIFKYLEPIVREAIAYAKVQNRNIEIITDLTSEDNIAEYRKQPTYANLPLMCELDIAYTKSLNATYWGPRWTLGTLNAEVSEAHAAGIKAYSWTLNSESIIMSFLKDGHFDGFITDYPCYAVYHYYIKN